MRAYLHIALFYYIFLISYTASASSSCEAILPTNKKTLKMRIIDTLTLKELSKEVSINHQNKILNFFQEHYSPEKTQPGSNVNLILSGGTRATSLLTRENHKLYASFKDIQYRFLYPHEFSSELGKKQLYWMKIFALKKALYCDEIPEGGWVVWLDDDIIIDDFTDQKSMLDKYIDLYGLEGDILVANDIVLEKVNTGIILVRKNENTRSFLHMWSLYSNDPKKGYMSQKETLHEQHALKEFLQDKNFIEINKSISLVKVVPARDENYDINLNTFKRETYVNTKNWVSGNPLIEIPGENEQTYRDGDAFIHHGTKDYRTRAIIESLTRSFMSYKGASWRDSSWIMMYQAELH